jgi:hypothetical protein
MPNKLAILVLAAAFAVSIIPAHAAGMPDSGTKNFIPGGDTPTYLTNENLAVAPGTAAEPAAATAFDQTEGPERSAAAPMHSVQTKARRHGKLAAGRKTAHHAAANGKTKTRSIRVASTTTARGSNSAALGKNPRPVRSASRTASAARTGTAKHVKANARHASAKSAARRG